jgi:site-specific DNA recombinase
MRRSGATPAARNGVAAHGAAAPSSPVRCAIYGRKSVEDRTATDFGSIEAQRESCEAFVKSQAALGWTALPTRYDDEGFTGANVDRPALARLLADIEAGNVDAVVVYKIDRLSRSIADFVGLMETFDRRGVSFVSVTQQFNTSTSVGRLTLNLLTVFAQFERETISERTRDKMRAARRRGKFTGGALLLGYDRAPEGRRLVVNEAEAARVRAIFDLYLDRRSLVAVVQEAGSRGWTTKSWVTKQNRVVPARPMTRMYVAHLLKNPAYVGKVRIGGEVFPAEHASIVEERVFEAAQRLLAESARTGGRDVRNKHHMLLTGLISCASCDRPMVPTYCKKRGRLYRYYVCRRTREEGWGACPTKSVSATQIEQLVVEQIRAVGGDSEVFEATLASARAQADGARIDTEDLRRALSLWDNVWAALTTKEQARVMALLVERVAYDGETGTAALTYRPSGIRGLAEEVAT